MYMFHNTSILRKNSYLSTYNILLYSKSTTGDSITGDF